ncbi:dermonecrotic toxin domain-containing protein [Pseudomonas eucalypticola]|uniref:RING-type E3 ubiquitin transferase n=1 Tax=Pseudomonas eucalypticola TaxID=2599595 RepID=A0A7D5D7N6_9PSED|nr:DUF6543 domain-containing protein [Pseudomonas eucalypticola]QKZ05574.1 hypothetical protein HWQ56_17950 [Pseudomonas eucalypticola]
MLTTSYSVAAYPEAQHTGLLADNLPGWLRQASPALSQAYWHWAAASLRSSAAVQALLGRVQAPHAFAEDHLVKALAQRFNRTVAVRESELVWLHHTPGLPNLTDRQRTQVTRHNLLQAAMANFAPQHLQATGFGVGSVILPKGRFNERGPLWPPHAYDEADRLGIEPVAFARACRELDLGAAYQQHLLDTLGPAVPDATNEEQTWRVRTLEQHLHAELQVNARAAHLRGQLSDDALQCLIGTAQATWAGRPVEWGRLRILVTRHHDGFALQPMLVLRQAGAAPARCLVYCAGEGPMALREYTDWPALCEDWRQGLLDAQACARLERYVGHGQQAEFARRLLDTLRPSGWFGGDRAVDPAADLGLRWTASSGPVAQQLRRQWLEKSLGDGATWVVPTAEQDRQAHAALMARLEATGMDLATLAALFVPGLGLAMAAVGAVQLLRETYLGVDDWRHGQRDEALGHFASVACNLGFMAVTAGAERLGQPSAFVEGMLPVVTPAGEQRLIALDLQALAVAEGPPPGTPINAKGHYVHAGQAYLRLDGRWYLHASEQGADWIRPSQAGVDWKVAVRHNGQGGWRGAHEDPGHWSNEQLMRRFGPALEPIDTPVLEGLRQAIGLSREQLVRLHLDNRPLPCEAQAGLEYLGLAPARQPGSMGGRSLGQQFSGLPAASAEAIAAGARRGERRVLGAGRVPLRLAEQAHLAQREARLNEALLDLWRATPGSRVANRLLEAGARRMPGWPADLKLTPDEVPADTDIAEQLWQRLSPAQQDATGCSDHADLRRQVFERLAADRGLAAQAIGQARVLPWLRPPVRQANGLLGYPLSGRGGQGIRGRLRLLYPTLDELHLEELEAGLGDHPHRNMLRLEAEFGRLTATLEQWRRALVDVADDVDGARLQDRVSAVDMIRCAWQRDTHRAEGPEWEGMGYVLDLSDLELGDLPALDADFSHIDLLLLDNVGLQADPSPFLQAFTHLRALELRANQLTAVPAAVAQLPWLGRLHLDHNLLQASDTLFAPLTGLQHLRYLALSDNPMTLSPAAMQDLGGLGSLRQLYLDNVAQGLSAADVGQLARLTQLRLLSLRDNGALIDRQGVLALGQLPHLETLRLAANSVAPGVTFDGFAALRELDLEGCELEQWPEGLSALMNRAPLRLEWVSLLDNPLVELPPLAHLMFFRAPRALGMQPLDIDQGELSNGALQRLLDAGIEPHLEEPVVAAGVPPVHWRQGLDAELANTLRELQALPAAGDFLLALDRLASSPTTLPGRLAARLRIHSLLRAISVPADAVADAGLTHLREMLFAVADDALNTCGDGITLVFNRWETHVLFYQASTAVQEGPQAMAPVVAMARGIMQGELLDERTMAVVRRRQARRAVLFPQAGGRLVFEWEVEALTPDQAAAAPALDPLDDLADRELMASPDEAELRLLLRHTLAMRLGLPLLPAPMLYGELASEQMMLRMAAWVEQQATPQRLEDWLVNEPAWRDLLRRRSPAPFERLQAHWYSGQEYLFELSRPQPDIQPLAADVLAAIRGEPVAGHEPVTPDLQLSEADQEAARQRLGAAERAAFDALVRTMTREFL